MQKCQIWEYKCLCRELSPEKEYFGFTSPKSAILEKNAEFINANGRSFQVLRNLILRKRAKFALINSVLIYAALIYYRIYSFP